MLVKYLFVALTYLICIYLFCGQISRVPNLSRTLEFIEKVYNLRHQCPFPSCSTDLKTHTFKAQHVFLDVDTGLAPKRTGLILDIPYCTSNIVSLSLFHLILLGWRLPWVEHTTGFKGLPKKELKVNIQLLLHYPLMNIVRGRGR